MENNCFEEVYPFTTENVSAYLKNMNLKGKSLLTVGSSLDQVFNPLVLDVKSVTLLDINPYTKEYFEFKKNIILTVSRKKLYRTILESRLSHFKMANDILSEESIIKANNYLQTEENYDYLREKLRNNKFDLNFITGNIFKIKEIVGKEKYDSIVLSNVLQYLEYFFKDKESSLKQLKRIFDDLKTILNYEGILQLIYLYSYSYQDILKNDHPILIYNLREIHKLLEGIYLEIEWIPGICNKNEKDAIVSYKKQI